MSGNSLSSEDLAALIVTALVDSGLVKADEFEQAMTIVTEELDARRSADGD